MSFSDVMMSFGGEGDRRESDMGREDKKCSWEGGLK